MKNGSVPVIKFTKGGYDKIQSDFEKYTKKRVEVVTSLKTARDMGDLSENGAYKAARFELGGVDRQLRRLKYLLRFGKVVEERHSDRIDFGSTVTLDDGTKKVAYLLVSGFESDPKQNKLSIYSPIGKVLVGKKTGDTVFVNAPAGQTAYKIVNVG